MAVEENGTATNTVVCDEMKNELELEDKACSQKEHKAQASNSSLAADPCMFAPTGDIYSYFQRRPIIRSSYNTFLYPFRYATKKALSCSVSVT